MKIGLVIPSTPGYSETFFYSKIKGLKENGFDVILFTQIVDGNFNLCPVVKSPAVNINFLSRVFGSVGIALKLLVHLKTISRYYKLLSKQKYSTKTILKRIYLNSHILTKKVDWLHFGFTTQALGSEYVAKAIGAKMAVSFRGFDINVYPLKHINCYDQIWKTVDKVHSISKYLVHKAVELGLNSTTPYSIITPAVDAKIISKFPLKIMTNDLESIQICTVARLNWIKDLTTAIETINILVDTFPKLIYHIIGDGTTKEQERYLFMVKQLGLEDRVVFHKKLSHSKTLELVNDSDIYLQTSLNEGFCNAVLEAQALGKLCVATNVGGLGENIIDGVTGWLVKLHRPDLLARRIIEVTQLSADQKQEVVENAKRRIEKDFLLDNQISKFSQFYIDKE